MSGSKLFLREVLHPHAIPTAYPPPPPKVMMWLDILTLPQARRYPPVPMEPPSPLKVHTAYAPDPVVLRPFTVESARQPVAWPLFL